MAEIIPAILVKDITSLEQSVGRVGGVVDRIQIDVVDGKYKEVETVTPEMMAEIDCEAGFEIHLMVDDPFSWVERCVAGGAVGVIGQVEKMNDVLRFVGEVEASGLRCGLGFELETKISDYEEWINMVDVVLLMGVPSGAQGQKLDKRVLDRIREVRAISPYVTIMIDGGMNKETIALCLRAGGEKMEFAVGSEISNADNVEDMIEQLRSVR
jgi:ribulose-phosphate 3-epimerase